MNSNRIVLIIIAIMSFMLSLPKLQQESLTMIIITVAVGYSVTKNVLSSVCVALILGAIYVSLTSVKKIRHKIEHFESKKNNHKEKYKNSVDNFSDNDSDVNEDFTLDTKNSFYENYKNLTPNQIKGLNSDTKELMTVQKELMETLKNMKEPLQNGKQILDTFKDYFGSDNVGNLSKKLKF